jgi:UDP-N-acetylmuramate dehydrogenase
MKIDEIGERLRDRGFGGVIEQGALLSGWTTYRIGGPARLLVQPSSRADVRAVLELVEETGAALYVIGGGSKLLAPDEGVEGIVMVVGDLLAGIAVDEALGEVIAGAGARNADLAAACARAGFPGLEFLADIPGRVGGSLVQDTSMNEERISNPLADVSFFRRGGVEERRARSDLRFSYRSSSFKTWNDTVIVEARFRFAARDDPAAIAARMEEIRARRHARFPADEASCGSVFLRPPGDFPGRVVQAAGLGPLAVGGAQISPLHNNFIVNRGGARAADVKALVDRIHAAALEKTGIDLRREIIYMEEIRFGGPPPVCGA